MDEQQALLGRGSRSTLFTAPVNDHVSRPSHPAQPPDYPSGPYDENGGSSSDGSESWWEDSHSSCSSCSRTSSSSDEDWDDVVTEEGELLYIEPVEVNRMEDRSTGVSKVPETTVKGVLPAVSRAFSAKEGKFVRWIRRRESKRQRPKLSVVCEQPTSGSSRSTLVNVDVNVIGEGKLNTAAIGLQLSGDDNGCCVVQSLLLDGPLADNDRIAYGDILRTVNEEEVVMKTLDLKLASLMAPLKVSLGFQKRKESHANREKPRSKKVLRMLDGEPGLENKLSKFPAAVMAIDVSEQRQEEGESDLVFCYPANSPLAAARGSYITLAHLLPSIVDSECKSCTCEYKDEEIHVIFYKEDNLLLLLALPDRICRLDEACHVILDLARALQFNYQTLHCCFQKEAVILERFFSSFFSRMFSSGSTNLLDLPLNAIEPVRHHFHEYLAEVPWIPLPREAQLQLDDALNELESCDFGHSDEDAMESERVFIVLGSCLYHQGYLVASHLTKEDLLDVHSLLRQNGLLELSSTEGVNRLVMWREVFPHSVNRGLPPTGPSAYPPPVGRWFLLLVSTGEDMLSVLLENAGCCLSLPNHPKPHRPHVREAEDTLAHIQSLGLTSLAAQWLACRARPRTTVRPPTLPKTKERSWNSFQRSTVDNRLGVLEHQEDSASQTASNVSNPSNTSNASESDENAPILGRRAERSGICIQAMSSVRELSDDSQSSNSDSDSDWGSFKGLSIQDGNGLFDNPYLPSNLGDLGDLTPSKITTGPDNQLFHFVLLDGNEGVLVTPGGEQTPPSTLMSKFTEAAHRIHAQLDHNVRFRTAADPRGVLNKSLIAVKECGVLLDVGPDEKPHWIVGRLFFTPKPREVYVCYSDDAPQNILEIAFRLGLGVAG